MPLTTVGLPLAQLGQESVRMQLDRLEEAANILLQVPFVKVESVARQVGFSSPSRFASAFRERFGAYPAAYRDSARRRLPRPSAVGNVRIS